MSMYFWFNTRLKYHGDGDMILHHKRGIYSLASKPEKKLDQVLDSVDHFDAIQFNKNSGKSFLPFLSI